MAWLPGDGERVAVASSRAEGEEFYLDLHSTASGERVRRVYGPEAAVNQEPADRDHGVWLDVAGGLRWYSLVPGAHRPSGTYTGGVTFRDLTGTHLYRDATPVSGETGDYRRVTLRDPRERDRFWSLTFPGRDGSRALGIVGEGSGPRTVLAVEGDTLLRSRPEPVSAVEKRTHLAFRRRRRPLARRLAQRAVARGPAGGRRAGSPYAPHTPAREGT
jgi:hypothetical protein